jgi:cell division protein ZapA
MGQVVVTIAGRPYRMACEDGEEDHLEGLARALDEKISQMRSIFGEIGDQRLVVMSAISIADELRETRQRLAQALTELEQTRTEIDERGRLSGARTDKIAEGLEEAAERLEQLARAMNASGKDS